MIHSYGVRNGLNLACFTCLVMCMVEFSRAEVVFDVTKYSASPNGTANINSKAFLNAWDAACAQNGSATLVIPPGTFLVGSISFKGPCMGPSSPRVRIHGTLKAPGLAGVPGLYWIEFRNLQKLAVDGGGVVDGQGADAWTAATGLKSKNRPMSLRLINIDGGRIADLAVQNSKGFHVAIQRSTSIAVHRLNISAPGNSPNTDGIHVSRSSHVNLTSLTVGTGDDCISIGPGSTNITVFNVTCGPGHGISVGSLGKYENEEDVAGVRVRNCTVVGTTNGVRIKTWPGSPPSAASDITFEDIVMHNVTRPIIIDQVYCPVHNCTTLPSHVKIQDVAFRRIRGTTNSPVAVTFSCSPEAPCQNVQLQDINLDSAGTDSDLGSGLNSDLVFGASTNITSSCSNVLGSAFGMQKPHPCF
uniref:Exopolygalacturonase n=1 Tax=Ananas comosus var. bracteatus TaxID=296719 RepID=A0A6V7PR05_ANACO|nr:unnamed protein product [Ananas comosus var. bracteatus]